LQLQIHITVIGRQSLTHDPEQDPARKILIGYNLGDKQSLESGQGKRSNQSESACEEF